MTDKPHATVFDLPGWPCPPRVRDIPRHTDSWGWIPVSVTRSHYSVAQDEIGHLWVNGNVTPRFKHCNGSCPNPGAVVFFDPLGIGLWIHQDSMAYLPSISRLDMKPDEWLPVNVTPAELPAFIKGRA